MAVSVSIANKSIAGLALVTLVHTSIRSYGQQYHTASFFW